jgi:hypothetical protein
MVESFGIDCSGLVLDMTNFATYIDSANDKAPIARRGCRRSSYPAALRSSNPPPGPGDSF